MTFDSSQWFHFLAQEEKDEKAEAHRKLVDEIRERNRQREHEATFTEIWYTFVDPYATDVDERGNGQFKSNNYFFCLYLVFFAVKMMHTKLSVF